MMVLGIDEAGRGPAIGEMVVAAVAVTADQAAQLQSLGVADSKSFGAGARGKAKRAELATAITSLAAYAQFKIAPVAEIDLRVAQGELNALEREMAAALIDDAVARVGAVARIVADGVHVFAPLRTAYGTLEAHNRGEGVHIAVAAASIVAKAKRDELFAEICQRYAPEFGDIGGGGYLNDATRSFLIAYAIRHGGLLPEARRSWPYPFLAPYVTHGELRIH